MREIIEFFYPQDDQLRQTLIDHSRKVCRKALDIAEASNIDLDLKLVEEGSLLHDIGIFLTDAPRIHCHGTEQYLCHGYIGGQLLRSLGHERHARVCERHTGTGLTKEVIVQNGWNLPAMDFLPETMEEQLICFADKFFSKTKFLDHPRTLEQVVESMRKISDESAVKVQEWARLFM
jgi:uncharacterized protein